MLDKNDKQMLKELVEERFMEQDAQIDRRCDEMRQVSRVQYEAMFEALEQHAERLREETNARFEAMYADMIRQFKDHHIEIESRVEDKLSITVSDHLQEA